LRRALLVASAVPDFGTQVKFRSRRSQNTGQFRVHRFLCIVGGQDYAVCLEWFANEGQVLQVIAAVVSAVIVLINVFVAKEKVPSVVVLAIALGWLAFSVVIFFRNRAQTAEIKTAAKKTAAASMEKIPFDYLPQESPSVHGWALLKEETGPKPPTFSSLSASAPVSVGLSIKPNGWCGMDYPITEAQKTRCNRDQN
jgi:hypothetical protein